MKHIELDISAIRQSDSQNNAYVLLLNEINGNRQLPIVIGWCEARAIAIGLEEKEKVTRPLTHDLFKTFGDKFEIKIKKVIIHTLIEGIFHASFHCENINTGEKNMIDARNMATTNCISGILTLCTNINFKFLSLLNALALLNVSFS